MEIFNLVCADLLVQRITVLLKEIPIKNQPSEATDLYICKYEYKCSASICILSIIRHPLLPNYSYVYLIKTCIKPGNQTRSYIVNIRLWLSSRVAYPIILQNLRYYK